MSTDPTGGWELGPLDPLESPGSGSGHPHDALSAWLDDELSPVEAGAVGCHLEQCPACRAELETLAEARRRLRAMVPLPPPPDLPEGVRRKVRRFVRRGVLVAVGGAVMAGAVLWMARPVPGVTPPDLATDAQAPLLAAAPGMPAGQIPAGYLAPGSVEGLPLASVHRSGSMIEEVYGTGGLEVAVIEERGSLVSPADPLTRTVVDGKAGWLRRWSGLEAFTGQYGDLAVTVVADPDDVPAAARDFDRPVPSGSWWDRARSLCRDVVEELTGSR